jgi:hypothetical protein
MKGQSVAGTQTTLLRYGRMHTSTYADTETQQAYLFQCDGNGLFAVSLDRSGANIPRGACVEGWRFRTPSCWASKRSCPRLIDPEPILRGIRAMGYYVWRQGIPRGTTQ